MAVSLMGLVIGVFLGLMVYNIIASVAGRWIDLPHISIQELADKVRELLGQ
jgi:hypothetical protein